MSTSSSHELLRQRSKTSFHCVALEWTVHVATMWSAYLLRDPLLDLYASIYTLNQWFLTEALKLPKEQSTNFGRHLEPEAGKGKGVFRIWDSFSSSFYITVSSNSKQTTVVLYCSVCPKDKTPVLDPQFFPQALKHIGTHKQDSNTALRGCPMDVRLKSQ